MTASLGFKAETTYGTPVTVDTFFPFIEDGLEPEFATVDADDEIYVGAYVERQSASDPYIAGCSGPVKMYVPTKKFGLLLKHAFGAVATSGPTDSNYSHTFTLNPVSKYGLSLTGQSGRPFNPSGTVQPFTWHGLKVLSLELAIEEEGFLTATIEFDGEDVDTGTGLATPSYASIAVGAAKFPWRLASLTVDAAQVEVKHFRCKLTWPHNTGRRYLRGSALKKEPTVSGKAMIEWDAQIDFADLAAYNKVAATAIATRCAALVLTCDGPTALAGATVPRLSITLPAARYDKAPPTVSSEEPLLMDIGGIAMDDDSAEPITVVYRTTDATP